MPSIILLGGTNPSELVAIDQVVSKLLPPGWSFFFTACPGTDLREVKKASSRFLRTCHPYEWRSLAEVFVAKDARVVIVASGVPASDFRAFEEASDYEFSSLCDKGDILLSARASASSVNHWRAVESLPLASPVQLYRGMDFTGSPLGTGSYYDSAISVGLAAAHVRRAFPDWIASAVRQYLRQGSSSRGRLHTPRTGYGSLWEWPSAPAMPPAPLRIGSPLGLKVVTRGKNTFVLWEDYYPDSGLLTEVELSSWEVFSGLSSPVSILCPFTGKAEARARHCLGSSLSDWSLYPFEAQGARLGTPTELIWRLPQEQHRGQPVVFRTEAGEKVFPSCPQGWVGENRRFQLPSGNCSCLSPVRMSFWIKFGMGLNMLEQFRV